MLPKENIQQPTKQPVNQDPKNPQTSVKSGQYTIPSVKESDIVGKQKWVDEGGHMRMDSQADVGELANNDTKSNFGSKGEIRSGSGVSKADREFP